jgi:hypothetical protein
MFLVGPKVFRNFFPGRKFLGPKFRPTDFLSLVIANVVNTPTKFKKGEVKQILEKLEKCSNINNDPRTDEYKKKRLEQFQSLTDYETKHLVN